MNISPSPTQATQPVIPAPVIANPITDDQANAAVQSFLGTNSNAQSNSSQNQLQQFNAASNNVNSQLRTRKQQLQLEQAERRLQQEKDREQLASQQAGIQLGKEIADQFDGTVSQINIAKGLGLAFVILIGLIWALIPTASGYTRAQLLWFTLLGESKLTTAPTDQTSADGTNTNNILSSNIPTGLSASNIVLSETASPDQIAQISPTQQFNIDFDTLGKYGNF